MAWRGITRAAAITAVLIMLQPAAAQVSAWLSLDSEIKGNATDPAHKNWIVIHGFNAGSVRAKSKPLSLGRPMLLEVGLTKSVDNATPALIRSMIGTGTTFPRATLDLTTDGTAIFARLEMENVLVSSLVQSATTTMGQAPSELFSLNFTKLTYFYTLPDGGSLYSAYDAETNTSQSGILPPADADADADGMLDRWEVTYGLNITINDAKADADGDGLINLHEFQLGTHPRSASSFFKATLMPKPESPGSYLLTWNTVSGKSYIIEWSPDLATPFTALRTITASGTTTTETMTTIGPLGFFRVRPQ